MSTPLSVPKSRRSNRKRRSSVEVKEEEEEDLVTCLVNLARGGEGNAINNPVRSPQTKKPRLLVQQEEEEEALKNIIVHECSVCGRNFQTGQALGGHMSSHTYALKKSTKLPDEIKEDKSDHVHKCSVCAKVFDTGQALGGHMRKHYGPGYVVTKSTTSEPGGDAAKKISTSETGGAANAVVGGDEAPSGTGDDIAAVVVNDFDLNEPPPESFLCDEVRFPLSEIQN